MYSFEILGWDFPSLLLQASNAVAAKEPLALTVSSLRTGPTLRRLPPGGVTVHLDVISTDNPEGISVRIQEIDGIRAWVFEGTAHEPLLTTRSADDEAVSKFWQSTSTGAEN